MRWHLGVKRVKGNSCLNKARRRNRHQLWPLRAVVEMNLLWRNYTEGRNALFVKMQNLTVKFYLRCVRPYEVWAPVGRCGTVC